MAHIALGPIVKKYQKLLRLQDWELEGQWLTEEEMIAFMAEDKDEADPKRSGIEACAAVDAYSASQWDTSYIQEKRSRIVLKKGAFFGQDDVESTVLHEMLHILLWPLSPNITDDVKRMLLEQIVLTLEKAIYEK